MSTKVKLEVICVRCGDVHDFGEEQVKDDAHLQQLFEEKTEFYGWQTLRGWTDGKRNGRCARHAIRLEGGKA